MSRLKRKQPTVRRNISLNIYGFIPRCLELSGLPVLTYLADKIFQYIDKKNILSENYNCLNPDAFDQQPSEVFFRQFLHSLGFFFFWFFSDKKKNNLSLDFLKSLIILKITFCEYKIVSVSSLSNCFCGLMQCTNKTGLHQFGPLRRKLSLYHLCVFIKCVSVRILIKTYEHTMELQVLITEIQFPNASLNCKL